MPESLYEHTQKRRQHDEASEYATKHTPQGPAGVDVSGAGYGDAYMKNVAKAGLRRQARAMRDTAESTDLGYSQRAARDLGGPRTPPHK